MTWMTIRTLFQVILVFELSFYELYSQLICRYYQLCLTTVLLVSMFRGLTPRLVMYMSQGALFFASYEFLKRLFSLEMPQFSAQSIQYKERIEDDSASLPIAS